MKTPKLRIHASSGRYLVRVNGRDIYLGKNRAAAEVQYHQMMMTYAKMGDCSVPSTEDKIICELIEAYILDRMDFYGEALTSFDRGKAALRYLNRGFGHFRVDQFGMLELRRLRENMMQPTDRGKRLCRGQINAMMREVARFWKWCAEMEFAPAELYAKCKVLEPLKRGHCKAPESDPIRPVLMVHVEAIKKYVNRSVAALVDLQVLTGARSGELLELKAEDIDRSGAVWKVELIQHKTAHRGKKRVLYFGERAQAVLRPLLLKRGPGEYLFSPQDHLDRVREMGLVGRREGQPETIRLTNRVVGVKYDTDSYRRAITRACDQAGIPRWHPHQLRHTAATEFRKQYGVEAARAALGHAHVNATEIYAEVDAQIAERIAAEIG